MGILSDLSSQRETILHMRSNMGIVSSELSSAGRKLNRLIRGAQRQKVITYAVAFLLMLGLVVWVLCYLGLSMKWTVLAAICIVFLAAIAVVVRQRLHERRQV